MTSGRAAWLFDAPYAALRASERARGPADHGLRESERRRRALVVAGLWTGVAATFKYTGLFALRRWCSPRSPTRRPRRATPVRARAVQGIRLAAACSVPVVVALCYRELRLDPSLAGPSPWRCRRHHPRGCRPPSCATSSAGAPTRPPTRGRARRGHLAAFFALPPLAWVLRGARRGGRSAGGLLAVPASVRWFLPLPVSSLLALLVTMTGLRRRRTPGRGTRAALGMRRWPSC
jgi:hypothetical protein